MLTAPNISKDLLAYLEKAFPSRIPQVRLDAHPNEVAAAIHRITGRGEVVAHLWSLYETQQNEDPLNVHEDTEAP